MDLKNKIEAYLFFKGEPVSVKDISSALKVETEEIKEALKNLKTESENRGIRLVEHAETVMLGTPPEMSKLFEDLRKEELSKELSKAALETLSIVLYHDEVTRAEINFIRGVNSSFILRALEVRGLVERQTSKKDARMNVYRPTLELLGYLGVSSVSELPQFQEVKATLESKLLNQEVTENAN